MKLFRSFIALCVTVLMLCTMCFSAFAYNDVSEDNENFEAINFVDKLGIITSSWDGDFRPEQYLSRADAVVAVYKMLYGEKIDAEIYEDSGVDFITNGETGDIAETSALVPYLCWAVDNYLISTNVENSMFKPADPITANELLTLLAKVLCLVEDGAEYPDQCVEAISGIETGIEAGDNPITREQAAIAFAAALVSADGSSGEIGVYTDDDGNPLNSLAATVYNMANAQFTIRATLQRPLGHEVKNGVLLSNGVDVDLGTDLSEYIGYGISLTYSDADRSLTYTEDEKLLTYSIMSTMTTTVPLSTINITNGHTLSGNSAESTFAFTTYAQMYLNDDVWPQGDKMYDPLEMVSSIKLTEPRIYNRPGLVFKFMQVEGEETPSTVFAYESRPGKVLGINNGIVTICDYYYSGTENEIRNYNISNCKISNAIKIGDIVSFYESQGLCYISTGNAIKTTLKNMQEVDYSIKATAASSTTVGRVTEYTFTDGPTHYDHLFFKIGDCPLIADPSGEGPIYTFITDGTEERFVVTWEAFQTNYANLMIDEISPDTVNAQSTIKVTNIQNGAKSEFTVKFDNINSTTPLEVGDIITYSDDFEADVQESETPKPVNVYVKKVAPETVEVRYDEDNKCFIDTNTQKVYYLNQLFKGNLGGGAQLNDGDVATVTLMLDMAHTVVYYKA